MDQQSGHRGGRLPGLRLAQAPGRRLLLGDREASRGILGVNVARLGQLFAKGFVPFVVHVDGTRLYRREQLEVVANARDARWH